MLSIFAQETTALESQVTALQSQLAVAQQRIAVLAQTELLAGGSLESLRTAISKVSELAPTAFATLKAAILALFHDGNDDDNGNEKAPAPLPNDPLEQHEITPAKGLIAYTEVSCPYQRMAIDAPRLALKEQTDHTAPDAAVLEQVESEIIKEELVDQADNNPVFDLVPVSDTVAYFRNNQTGEIVAAYVGFNNRSKAEKWGKFLTVDYSLASGFELRNAKRLPRFKFEIKIWGLSLIQIQKLAESTMASVVMARQQKLTRAQIIRFQPLCLE